MSFLSTLLRIRRSASRHAPSRKPARRVSRRMFSPELLEDRSVPAAVPTAALTVPGQAFIGSDVKLSVAFTNASPTDAGYAPYLDLYLPATGVDGAGAGTDDGITYNTGSATYLGSPVTPAVLTFDAAGHATHPYAKDAAGKPLVVSGTPGDQLVVFQMPFGSFTPGQPPATVDLTAHVSNLADLNQPLNVKADAGFALGNDPLDDPATDPSIVGPAVASQLTPTLIQLVKTYIGPEQETATGPNFPRQYKLSVQIAPGQTVSGVALSDLLPGNMQYAGLVSAAGNGSTTATTTLAPSTTAAGNGSTTATTTLAPSTTTPGGTLTETFDKLVGLGTAADAATVVFGFYIPEYDNAGKPVLPLTTGAFAPSTDTANVAGSWKPIDARDPVTQATATASDTITDKSIAIQKSVALVGDVNANGVSPRDTLEYTLNFQVSDFFAFQNVDVTDVISDGQAIDASFTPTITFTQHGQTYTGSFTAATFAYLRDTGAAGSTGQTTATFKVSDLLATLGNVTGGRLLGGSVPDAGTGGAEPNPKPAFGGTVGTITFRTKVLDYYTDKPAKNAPVVQGDHLGDAVSVTGSVLDYKTAAYANGPTQTDTSAAAVDLPRGVLTKSIYAINGKTNFGTAAVQPGDTVTYRLTYTLPASDIVAYQLSDYLPLPIFHVGSFGFDAGVSGAARATAPASGHIQFGPADTFYGVSGVVPAVSTNATGNSLTLDFGTFKDPQNRPATTDILFTVTAGADPFADGLFLTNQAHEFESSSTGGTATKDAIVQIKILEPKLKVTKGVVATNDKGAAFSGPVGPVAFNDPGKPGAKAFAGTITSDGLSQKPVDANLTKAQGGDLVTFAVAVENQGHSANGAYNVTLKDTLPAGFHVPAAGAGLNFKITDGAGNPLAYTKPDGTAATPGDFFGGGIRLKDGALGALAGYDATSGKNIVVITYDLQANAVGDKAPDNTPLPPVQPLQVLTNTASVDGFASTEAGPNFLASPLADTSTVTVAPPTVGKTAVTEISAPNNNAGNQVVIGELVTYTVTVAVPQGVTKGASLVDTLPAGLALVNLVSVTPSAGVTYAGGTGLNASLLSSSGGRSISYGLGTVTDANASPSTADTITFVYRAITLDVASNKAGAALTNSAALAFTDAAGTARSSNAGTATINVVEPKVLLSKAVVVNGVAGGSGDAGDPVTYYVALRHDDSTPNAYGVTLTDPLPKLIQNPVVTVSDPSGIITPANFKLTGSNAAGWTLTTVTPFDLPYGTPSRLVTVAINGTLGDAVTPGQTITNTAADSYKDLPGAPSAVSPYDAADSHARTTAGAASAAFTVYPATALKTLRATSEASTTGSNVTIGEVVRYRLVVAVPQTSTLPAVQVQDLLPAGLAFLNDGTVTAGFVNPTSGGAIVSSKLSGAGLNIAGDYTSGDQLDAVGTPFVVPASAISSTAAGPVFSLGDVANTARDPKYKSFIVLNFNAVVQNVASNVAGKTLVNSFQALSNGTLLAGSPSNSVPVTVVEPKLALAKSVVTPGKDAGDDVVYQLVVTNTGSATAFDAVLFDGYGGLASPYLTKLRNVQVVSAPPGVTVAPAGTPLTESISQLAPGQSVTVRYTETLTQAVTPGLTVTNTAVAAYSSLPGTNGTTSNPTMSKTPGSPGSSTGERNDPHGAGDAVNNYITSSSASVVVAAPSNLAKTVFSTSESATPGSSVAVGETVTYRVTFTLSEATYSQGLKLTDLLPSGPGSLTYVGSKVVSIGSKISGSALAVGASGTASGQAVLFDFGTGVVDKYDNVSDANDQITVEVTAKVPDAAGNVDGAKLVNTATLDYKTGTLTATAPVAVVEPKLTVSKSASVARADAGDVVTYTVTVAHAAGSTGPAFDVALTDPIPAGGQLVAGSVTTSAGGTVLTGNGAGDTTVKVGVVGNTPIPVGGTLTVTYKVKLTAAAQPGSTVTNTAALGYDHGPGTRPDGGTAQSSVVINTNAISGFVYVDANNDGVYQPGSETPIGGVTVTLTGVDNLGNPVSVPVVTTADGSYLVTGLRPGSYTLTEAQPAAYYSGKNTPGTQFGGTAAAPPADTIAAIAIPRGSNTTGVNYDFGERIAADIAVVKTADDLKPVYGTNVAYTILVTNNGPSAATGVKVTDLLPAGLSLVSFSPSQGVYDPTTGVWAVGSLGSTGSVTLNIVAKVTDFHPITNTATKTGEDQFDQNPANDASSVTVTPVAVDLGVTKTVSNATPTVGYTVTYAVGLTNTGPLAATGVTVTDVLPAGLSFVSATPSQGTYDPGTGLWAVGTVAVGANPTLTVVARVMTVDAQTNTAAVSHTDQPDVNPANDKASVTETPVLCDGGLLSVAAGYNVFVFGGANVSGSEALGRMAVGGDATLTSYGIGDGPLNPTGNPDSLVVGGALTYTNGQVFNGNLVYGTAANLTNVNLLNGTARQQAGRIDFTAVRVNQLVESSVLAARVPNGAVQNSYGTLQLTGTDPTINVFTVSGAQLAGANGVNITAPAGSVVILNVSGTNDRVANLGITISGTDRTHVVWNFYEATDLELSGVALQGSVLAPKARVNFANGAVDGTLVADSLVGSGEFHDFPTQVGCVAYTQPADTYAVTADVRHMAGTVSYFQGQAGQTLVNAVNGGPTSTALASWLASNYANLYGSGAGANDLTGKTNADVAALFQQLAGSTATQADAQVLAVAVSDYLTTPLGGSTAQNAGFVASANGLGATQWNVAGQGAAFGVADGTVLTVAQMLQKVNAAATGGKLFGGNATLADQAATAFADVALVADVTLS